MYEEWHKYDLAVAELEKAASLTPDSPDLQVSLGMPTSILARTTRGWPHSIKPLNWPPRHGVEQLAYQLSLKDSHLDGHSSMPNPPCQPPPPPFAMSRSTAFRKRLAAGFVVDRLLDTLGWVHFAEGDFGKAEKYVGAAWDLATSRSGRSSRGKFMKNAARKIAHSAPMRCR